MRTKRKSKEYKVNRRTFIQMVADRSGYPEEVVEEIYDHAETTAKEIVASGKELFLIGFGSFFLSRHKRHPVRYGANEDSVGDYIVFKFSPSNVFVKQLREQDEKKRIDILK